MKYIDAEKLIEGIKHIQSKFPVITYEALFHLITSLQQEQPEVDLENYLENYFKGWYIDETIGLTKPDGWSCIVADLKDVARHFYELGRLNARKEK